MSVTCSKTLPCERNHLLRVDHAVPGDEDAIAALCAELDEFYGDAPEGTPAGRAAQVSAALFADPPLARVLLARDEGALAGFASYSFLWPAAGLTASLYLKELYVAQAYRRAGVGQMLMQGLYRIAADRGCSRVEWTTDHDNPGAQAFYASLGVKPRTSKIFYRAGGEDLEGSTRPVALPAHVPNTGDARQALDQAGIGLSAARRRAEAAR
jgi:GNAT superfamily N-acetyltransferase